MAFVHRAFVDVWVSCILGVLYRKGGGLSLKGPFSHNLSELQHSLSFVYEDLLNK